LFFNAFVDGAYWLAIALIGASVGLMLVVLLLHRRNARYRRTVDSLLSIWKNALEQTLRGEACDVPVREKRTAVDMLRTWCDVSETSGLLPEAWFAAARRAKLHTLAREFVEYGDAPERVVGARALGFLKEPSALLPLAILSEDPDGDVSFAAASALVRIDPSRAAVFVVGVRDRGDWNAPQVEQIVREQAQIFGAEFVRIAKDADDAGLRRLLEFVPLLQREVVRTMTLNALERPRGDIENAPAALRALRSCIEPADVSILEQLAGDPVPAVRVQAVNALGDVDHPQAQALLVAHLNDADAWVRRRATEALARRAEREALSCPP
jgi:HEAT repeat protein